MSLLNFLFRSPIDSIGEVPAFRMPFAPPATCRNVCLATRSGGKVDILIRTRWATSGPMLRNKLRRVRSVRRAQAAGVSFGQSRSPTLPSMSSIPKAFGRNDEAAFARPVVPVCRKAISFKANPTRAMTNEIRSAGSDRCPFRAQVVDRILSLELVRRRSGGATRTRDQNNPVLVLQQLVTGGDRQKGLTVLLALIRNFSRVASGTVSQVELSCCRADVRA